MSGVEELPRPTLDRNVAVGAVSIQALTSDEWTDLGWTSEDGLSYTSEPDETAVGSWTDTIPTRTSLQTVTMAIQKFDTGFWDALKLMFGHLQRWADPGRAERLRRMHRAYRRRRS